MPANLTPQYKRAEDAYRQAQTAAERVACLETMLQLVPKHKGTEKLQAELKTRLKETREEDAAERKSAKPPAKGWRVPRQGAGQVVLLGGPNAGKSKLLAALTNAKPEIAAFPFTTREPMPGMMAWHDVTVQLVDTPPVTDQHVDGPLVGMVRAADGILLCFDGSSDDAPEQTEAVLKQFADRKTVLDAESGFGEDDYSLVRVRTLLVATRGNDPGVGDRLDFLREMTGRSLPETRVELEDAAAVAALRDRVWKLLEMIRVYTKAPGKKAERTSPFALPAGATVEDLAAKVHADLAAGLKFAKVWADGATDARTVGPDHSLAEADMVELHA